MSDPITAERRRRQEQGGLPRDAVAPTVSTLSGLTALGAAAVPAVTGGFNADSETARGLENQLKLLGYRSRLPGLAQGFYHDPSASASAQVFLNHGLDHRHPAGELRERGGLSQAVRYTDPPVSPEKHWSDVFEEISFDSDQVEPGRMVDEKLAVPSIDWDKTAQRLNRGAASPLTWTSNVPEYGPDLGSFQRSTGASPKPGQIKAYTVTPGVNSGRFANRLLPGLIDEVYGRIPPQIDPGQGDRSSKHLSGESYFTPSSAAKIPSSATLASDPGPGPIWAENDLADKVRAMDSMAPGQSSGSNQSAVLWGTTFPQPRYQYADVPGKSGGNPTVHVSVVEIPESLETDYAYTANAHSPYVRRYNQPPGEYTVGPHWGAAQTVVTPPTAGGRPKRDVAGDISWRADLTRSRGEFTLADAQSVQKNLGLPVTGLAANGEDGGDALARAIGSIREKLNLGTDAEVVDRYARRAPRLGRTTAPRQPATVNEGRFAPDVRPGIPSAMRQAYDLPGALERAGLPPTRSSLRQLNTEVGAAAASQLRSVNRLAGAAPVIGAIGGLLDPEAAGLLARSASNTNPERQRQLLLQGMTAFGRNTATGAAVGGAAQLGLRTLAAQAPAVAARVLPMAGGAVAVGGPVGLAASVYATADAVAEGLTGRSLTDRGVSAVRQSVSPAIVGPTASQAVAELFPAPLAVTANTATGAAVLTQTRPSRVGDRGAGGRVYAGQGWGWQSPASFARIQQQGRLPGSRPQQVVQGVVGGASQAVRNELQRRGQQAAQARQRGSRIPGLPELGLSEFIFGRRKRR